MDPNILQRVAPAYNGVCLRERGGPFQGKMATSLSSGNWLTLNWLNLVFVFAAAPIIMQSFIHRPTFYIVHHSGFLDSFLDLNSHTLEDCNFDRYLIRSETMADRAPLLPRTDSPYESSIFVSVCHSRWHFLGQRSLLLLRGVLAVYLSAILVLCVVREHASSSSEHLYFFDGRYLSFALQVVYYWITTVGCVIVINAQSTTFS